MDKICIIIPVHNRITSTLNCLEQLQNLRMDGFNHTIVIVDDGSSDGSSKVIMKYFPSVKIINGDGNLWWAGSINKGFEFALKNKYDFIYTLNNDITIFPDTLQILYSTLKLNKKAVCNSIRVYSDYIIAGFNVLGKFRKIKERVIHTPIVSHSSNLLEVDCLSTKSTLIPTSIITKVGFFDQKHFPHNYSDFDFFLRVKKSGFTLLTNFESRIITGPSGSNFHRLIINNSAKKIAKSFFNKKYGNHLKSLYFLAIKDENIILAYISFLIKIFPYMFWFFLKLILSKKGLIKTLKFSGRIE